MMNAPSTPHGPSQRWPKAMAAVLLVLHAATAAAQSGRATLILSTHAPATYGNFEVTATVTPADAAGRSVNFKFSANQAIPLSVYLDATGHATLVCPCRYSEGGTVEHNVYFDLVLSAGLHTIYADYAYVADRIPLNINVARASLNMQVAKAGTVTSLTSSQAGQAITYSALVSIVPSQTSYPDGIISVDGAGNRQVGTPTGTVTFFIGPNSIGSARLEPVHYAASAAIATLRVPQPSGPVTAVYSGDSNYEPSDTTPASLTSLVNAASHNSSSFAPDSIVAALGKNLAAVNLQATAEPAVGLGGVSAYIIDSTGVSYAAPMSRVSPAQIDLAIPASVAAGPATVSLATPTGPLTRPITIASISPGLFAANGGGAGVAEAEIVRIDAQGAVTRENVANFDAATNQWIPSPIAVDSGYVFLVLHGTGIRHHAPEANVVCTLGGQTVTPFYAGAESTDSGRDVVNLELPHTLAGAGKIDVTLLIDRSASNTVSVTIQ